MSMHVVGLHQGHICVISNSLDHDARLIDEPATGLSFEHEINATGQFGVKKARAVSS